jgi:hypothetical protein
LRDTPSGRGFFDFNLEVKNINAVNMHYKKRQAVLQSMDKWGYQHLLNGYKLLAVGTLIPISYIMQRKLYQACQDERGSFTWFDWFFSFRGIH